MLRSDRMATVDELKGLYQAAIEFRKMSPWQWVTEHHLFAVQDPETKETGFCCITGSKGEHLALNVYLGIAGLKGYFEMLNLDHEMMWHPSYFKTLWGQTCLVASFENEGQLSQREQQQIKALNLKFKGKNQYPQFKDYEVGFLPIELEDSRKCRFLTQALVQCMEVIKIIKQHEYQLKGDEILVRVQGYQQEWQTLKVSMSLFLEQFSELKYEYKNELAAYRINKLPQYNLVFEVVQFLLPDPVQPNSGERPFFPLITAMVEQNNGQLVFAEMTDSSRESYERLLDKIAQMFMNELKFRPACLVSDHDEIIDYLKDFCQKSKIPILKVDRLEVAHDLMDELIDSQVLNDDDGMLHDQFINEIDQMMNQIQIVCQSVDEQDLLCYDMSDNDRHQYSTVVELFHAIMLGNFHELPGFWSPDNLEKACCEILPRLLSDDEYRSVPKILASYLCEAEKANIIPNCESLKLRLNQIFSF